MSLKQPLIDRILGIDSADDFDALALEVFHFQYRHNAVYRRFCDALKRLPGRVEGVDDIPFLPVEMFRDHRVVSFAGEAEAVFSSSGTTALQTSRHFVKDLSLYNRSFTASFRCFYGDPSNYCILALLPSYLGREGSSLVYMARGLMELSGHPGNGFYLDDHDALCDALIRYSVQGHSVLLLGVSFALLDLVESHPTKIKEAMTGRVIVMETGGMKGRRREITREELHGRLMEGFGTGAIHSEYGMTELLSQAWSQGEGVFACPPWMRVLIRDVNDPLHTGSHRTGGIIVIDLANIYSCSFLATQDVGRLRDDVKGAYAAGGPGEKSGASPTATAVQKPLVSSCFEVLGRFDNSDIRGCNLMLDD